MITCLMITLSGRAAGAKLDRGPAAPPKKDETRRQRDREGSGQLDFRGEFWLIPAGDAEPSPPASEVEGRASVVI